MSRWFRPLSIGSDTPTRSIVLDAAIRAVIMGVVFGLGTLAVGSSRPLLSGLFFGAVMGALMLVQGLRERTAAG